MQVTVTDCKALASLNQTRSQHPPRKVIIIWARIKILSSSIYFMLGPKLRCITPAGKPGKEICFWKIYFQFVFTGLFFSHLVTGVSKIELEHLFSNCFFFFLRLNTNSTTKVKVLLLKVKLGGRGVGRSVSHPDLNWNPFLAFFIIFLIISSTSIFLSLPATG